MDHTDSAGIISQILKQSIVQAGIEVAKVRNLHTSWTKNTETRVSRLVRSADDAEKAQFELAKIQSQLNSFGGDQNAKSKKMMMGVTANNDKAWMGTVFTTWFTYTIKMRDERQIRNMFETQISDLDFKLQEYRAAALSNVKNVLMRKGAEGDKGLMTTCWKSWFGEVLNTRKECGSQAAMNAMEAKLAGQSKAQAENSKKVMARMASGGDSALMVMIFGSWVQWLEDYKKNKDEEDAVKASEKAMEEYLKKKKEGSAGIIDKMNAATDSGLLEHITSTWVQNFKDEKKGKKMAEMMAANEARFGALNGRQKDNAKGVMNKVNEQMALNSQLKCFAAWATDTKLERIMRHYNSKMESKKHQLQSVQSLFKGFANQLDQGLKEDSARGSNRSKNKEDGSV